MTACKTLCSAFFLLACSSSWAAAQDDRSTLLVKLWLYSVMVSPQQLAGEAYVEYTIQLSGQNSVSEVARTGGRFSTNKTRVVSLGRSSETNVTYKVVNATTLQRIANIYNYTTVVTIKVNGNQCTASYVAKPRAGNKTLMSWSQSLGVVATYSSIKQSRSNCTIVS